MWRLFHANTSCHAMTLTFDPLTLNFCGTSGVVSLCKIWARSNNPRQSYSRFRTFSPSNFWPGPKPPNRSQGCVDRTAPNLQGRKSDHRWLINLFQTSDILLRFQTWAARNRAMLKTMPNFALFDPPVKIRGGLGEISGSRFVALPRTEPRV